MKIDLGIEVNKDTFIAWLVCDLTAENGVFNQCFGSYTDASNEKISAAEIKLTVNGVELDAKPALERLYEDFKRAADKAGLRYAESVLDDAVTLKLKDHWPNYRERDE